eukprot:s20_g24.t1
MSRKGLKLGEWDISYRLFAASASHKKRCTKKTRALSFSTPSAVTPTGCIANRSSYTFERCITSSNADDMVRTFAASCGHISEAHEEKVKMRTLFDLLSNERLVLEACRLGGLAFRYAAKAKQLRLGARLVAKKIYQLHEKARSSSRLWSTKANPGMPGSQAVDKSSQELRLLDEYSVGVTLGEGAFGVVSVCKRRSTGEEYAAARPK